jgi:hypothetical protein
MFAVISTTAQSKHHTSTTNAALRYWLAFSDLQDPPSDKATTDLLEKTAAGEAMWDEAKLGSILDQNSQAIQRMQRATSLPECDWGLEYDLGPAASIAYVPRARVLARLNTLYGMRAAAKGDSKVAVETWLDGMRFSQHLSQGGSLIFLLVAKTALLSNLHAIMQAIQKGQLDPAQQHQISSAVRALPETAFDWPQALALEQESVDIAARNLANAPNPRAYFEELMGNAAPENFAAPTALDAAAFHKLMNSAEAALRLSPDQAAAKLKSIQETIQSLHPFYKFVTPSLTRINDSRSEIATTRAKLL